MAVPPPRKMPQRSTNPDPAKAALRAELRAARDMFVSDLAPGERVRLEARAAAHLTPLIEGAACVAFYQALGSELDCSEGIRAALRRGIAVALPHVDATGEVMRFLRWTPEERLEPGWRRLLQPHPESPEIAPDIIVAPLLGFDSAGWRIGQGAGFYDRAFGGLPKVKKIGLGWSVQQRPAIAHDARDVPLDLVVTEAGVIARKAAI
jgi:5-formyltetrahydrofolate cyclo-ligase